jgi:hypothetical protein
MHPRQPGTLKGNNIKYLRSLDIHKFDIIDLDAYGIPFDQLEIIFRRGYHGIVILTTIMLLQPPFKCLSLLGFPKLMVQKCPLLFSLKRWEFWFEYLGLRGVTKIEYIQAQNKLYGVFVL